MARDRVALLFERAVAFLALALVRGELGLPVSKRILQPLEAAHLHLDRLGALLVLDSEVLEIVRPLLRGRHVVGMRRVKVALKLLDEPLERETQHVVVLRVLVLDFLTRALKFLARVELGLVELVLHERHDVEQLLLVPRVARAHLRTLFPEFVNQLLLVARKLVLDAAHFLLVQIDETVDDEQVLHLDEAHQLAPLVHDLEAVDARVLFFLRLALLQKSLTHLLLGSSGLLLLHPLNLETQLALLRAVAEERVTEGVQRG
eukprot:5027573-Pleurochrysis_carterae.AAC.2